MKLTRRQFVHMAAAGVMTPWTVRSAAPIAGVHVGVQTYSFRDLPRPGEADAVDVIIAAMQACGLDECELWSPHVEPRGPAVGANREEARVALRQWRLSTPDAHFAAIRQRFAAAGLTIFAYNLSFNDSFTDAEIERGFAQARSLGAEVITASTTLPVARRLVPFATRHRLPVAMHNHSNVTDPDEFATPASFEAALAMSPFFRVNLDIGHFTAANFDPLTFVRAHHDRLSNLHLKDRRRNQGANVPWGTGDTPIRETLRWLQARRSPVRAYIEYEYRGEAGPVDEVRRCLNYVKGALG